MDNRENIMKEQIERIKSLNSEFEKIKKENVEIQKDNPMSQPSDSIIKRLTNIEYLLKQITDLNYAALLLLMNKTEEAEKFFSNISNGFSE